MIRKQLYITPETDRALKTEARRQGRSESEIVRQILREELKLNLPAKNPSEALIRLGRKTFKGPSDLSTNLFSYLYGDKSPNYGKKQKISKPASSHVKSFANENIKQFVR